MCRDGDLLMLRKNVRLPNRCIICCADRESDYGVGRRPRRDRRGDRHLAGPHGGHRGDRVERCHGIRVGICDEHRSRRRKFTIAGDTLIVLGVLAIASLYLLDVRAHPICLLAALVGVVLVFCGTFVVGLGSRFVRLKKEEGRFLWLRVAPAYLYGLPERVRPRSRRG